MRALTFEQIFVGRMALLGAQRHLANRTLRYDQEGNPRCQEKSDREAFAILENALSTLAREFTAKRARRVA